MRDKKKEDFIGIVNLNLESPSFMLPVGPQIRGIIFDLDGTLYLNGRLRRAMIGKLLRAGLRNPLVTLKDLRLLYYYRKAQEHIRMSTDLSADQQLLLACRWSGEQPERMELAVKTWMEESPLQILRGCLRPGIVELLKIARSRGIALGLLSDYPVGRKLASMGLSDCFSVTASAQDERVGTFKPSPKGLTVVLKELGVPPATAVYVGDRPTVDGAAAFGAGIAAIILGLPLDRNGPGWVGAPDISALRNLLEL